MALLSGKRWPQTPPLQGKGPLDPALPNAKYLKPSMLWSVASHLPLIIAVVVVAILVGDWLRILPSWLPFSSTHIIAR